MRHEDIERLLGELRHGSEHVRKFAALTLGELGDSAVVPHLERLTNDPEPSVRFHVRSSLGKLRQRFPAPAPVEPGELTVERVAGMLASDELETRVHLR